MAGRRPDSPALKLIKGARGASAASIEQAILPVEGIPQPPQHLNADGVKLWNEVITRLKLTNELDTAHLFGIEQLCYAWQRSRHKMKAGVEVTAAENRELTRMLNAFGMNKQNPYQESGDQAPKQSRFAGLKHRAQQLD